MRPFHQEGTSSRDQSIRWYFSLPTLKGLEKRLSAEEGWSCVNKDPVRRAKLISCDLHGLAALVAVAPLSLPPEAWRSQRAGERDR